MTAHYLGEWLHDANHYRMQLQGDAADNPDQRMTDDVKLFVDRTLNIGVGLLSSIVTLARSSSFSGAFRTPRRCICSARTMRSPAIWSGAPSSIRCSAPS